MTSFSQYFSILYLFFYTPAFFVDATPIIESAEAGVKLFEVQGHEAVQLQVPSTVSCSSQSGNLTWTKVDEEDAELNQFIQCRNESCRTSLQIEEPSETGNYSCCTNQECTFIYLFANDGEQLLVEESGYGIFLQVYQNVKSTIPCTPTNPDAQITLKSAITGRNINETNFGVEFSLFHGFTISNPVWDMEWTDLICRAQLAFHTVEVPVKIFWSPAPIYPLLPQISSSMGHFVGNDVRLNCSLKVEKGVVVSMDWKPPKTAGEVIQSRTHRIDLGSVTELVSRILIIKKSRLSDSGIYQCRASYSKYQWSSRELHITIENRSRIAIEGPVIFGHVNSELQFNIPVNKSLIPETYSLSKYGKLINDSRFLFEFSETMIHVRFLNTRIDDSGTYELVTWTADGFDACYTFKFVISDNSSTILYPFIFVTLFLALISITVVFVKSRNSKALALSASVQSMDYIKPNQAALSKTVPTKFIIERRHITLEKCNIGSGHFGSVSRGTLRIPGNGKKITVAIKRVREGGDQSSLMHEIQVMSVLEPHINVVNMIGTVIYPEIMIVVEFCPLGNLKDFLIKNRDNFLSDGQLDQDNKNVLSVAASPIMNGINQINPHYQVIDGSQIIKLGNLILYALQVADGMKFLASKRIIHRDLAARNVLLVNQSLAKICDFGLSKNCYNLPEAIYTKEKSSPLPYKWMAIESITDRVYTTKSDVWSYGIFLWEIFTLGSDPYPGHDINHNFVEELIRGFRLEAPKLAPETVGSIMTSCWRASPSDRPDFEAIYRSLGILEVASHVPQY